ncbi:unnamed protein product [Clavelina lepadiformis]|uniref:Cubilin n=1 Tax=Clavelina lepadiformis TaxID=159417 RepID=A0ABP0FKP2_CLALP
MLLPKSSVSICDVDNSTLTNASGVLASPNFPDHYPNSVLCSTTILAPADHVIAISFLHFQLESESLCDFDYLEITDGPDGEVELCGSELPRFNLSVTNSLTIKFKTDSSLTFEGFRLQWTQVGIVCVSDPCGVNATCTSTNGSYSCQCPEGFTGNAFSSCQDVDECAAEPCDVLETCTNTIGSFFCECPEVYRRNAGVCSISICDVDNSTLTNASGVLASPNFPDHYPNSVLCSTTILAPADHVIAISFLHFQLESESLCDFDYLEITDGPDGEVELCGSELPRFNLSVTNSLTIKFKTDSSLTFEGFRLQWTQVGVGCASDPCAVNATCTDTDGSYYCDCAEGFTGNGYISCQVVDECASNPCDENATCTSTDGSYVCECVDGYTGNGFVCLDAYECAENRSLCPISICDVGNSNLTGESGFLASPNFPNNYPYSVVCSATILAEADHVITITFLNFQLESHISCNYDSLKITDGSDGGNQSLGPLCGSALPEHRSFFTNSLTITFTSDFSVSFKGFRLQWTIVGVGCASDPCGVNATCTDTDGSYYCDCPEGFTGNAYISCQVVDECASNPCDENATCTSTDGSYVCECVDGYTGNGFVCLDAYECAENRSLCPISICDVGNSNLTGESGFLASPNFPNNYPYSVVCSATILAEADHVITITFLNFQLESHISCNYDSLKITDGSDGGNQSLGPLCGSALPEHRSFFTNSLTITFTSDFSVSFKGFRLQWTIVGVGCASDPCGVNATCTDTDGSYYCDCPEGFTGNAYISCQVVDECASNPCDENATCTSTDGSYVCECVDGYTGNGFVCLDAYECAENRSLCPIGVGCASDPCGVNATCTDTDGSYYCDCPEGFTGNAYISCQVVDECASNPCDENATCTSTDGSYVCECVDGYTGNGFVCLDGSDGGNQVLYKSVA